MAGPEDEGEGRALEPGYYHYEDLAIGDNWPTVAMTLTESHFVAFAGPLLLVAGGQAQRDGVQRVLEALGRGPFIFNLGHGITPQASPDNVAALVEQVRSWRP